MADGRMVMNESYRNFFGLKREPFTSDISLGEILETQQLLAVKERFDYAVRLGAAALVTGDIGSGKSTALRYAIGKLHPSEYRPLYVTATSGSILELYRQILSELGTDTASSSRAVLKRGIRREIKMLAVDRKMKAVLIVDEASLLELKVFDELHLIKLAQIILCDLKIERRTSLTFSLSSVEYYGNLTALIYIIHIT